MFGRYLEIAGRNLEIIGRNLEIIGKKNLVLQSQTSPGGDYHLSRTCRMSPELIYVLLPQIGARENILRIEFDSPNLDMKQLSFHQNLKR